MWDQGREAAREANNLGRVGHIGDAWGEAWGEARADVRSAGNRGNAGNGENTAGSSVGAGGVPRPATQAGEGWKMQRMDRLDRADAQERAAGMAGSVGGVTSLRFPGALPGSMPGALPDDETDDGIGDGLGDADESEDPDALPLGEPMDGEVWLRIRARKLIREFLRAVPRTEPEATIAIIRPDGVTRILSRTELTTAIDRLRPRQRQIIRLGVEERWPRAKVCAYLHNISMKTFERDQVEALDILIQI
jgi:hypothetical protein